MGSTEMGRVRVQATLVNLSDHCLATLGVIPADQVRRIIVEDALVDTGSMGLMLPSRLIVELGLQPRRTHPTWGIGGHDVMAVFDAVRLEIQGRDCVIDVGEVCDDAPVVIGLVPLESIDWVVDPKNQRLIGNPEHGGQWMYDAFSISPR